MMTWADYECWLLPLCVWREARSEGPAGMAAVAHVVINRMGKWQKSISSVITAQNQFSAMTVRGDPGTVQWPAINDKTFQLAMSVCDDALRGKDKDPTGGATFYRNPKTATSEWFQREIAESGKYEISAVIGRHEFWREKGAT